jgi:hypothetical protein
MHFYLNLIDAFVFLSFCFGSLMFFSQLLQAEHREWDQMLGSPSPKKMISNGHLPDIYNKDVRIDNFLHSRFPFNACVSKYLIRDSGIAEERRRSEEGGATCCQETQAGKITGLIIIHEAT